MGKYIVIWVAGTRDGETLAEFDNAGDAINFATKFQKGHETEFDPRCGGLAILDKNDKEIEW